MRWGLNLEAIWELFGRATWKLLSEGFSEGSGEASGDAFLCYLHRWELMWEVFF